MRFVAKVYVMDVMDSVVVSGYVFDAEDQAPDDHQPTEFAFTVPGTGLSDPYAWLLNSLYRALVVEQQTARSGS